MELQIILITMTIMTLILTIKTRLSMETDYLIKGKILILN